MTNRKLQASSDNSCTAVDCDEALGKKCARLMGSSRKKAQAEDEKTDQLKKE